MLDKNLYTKIQIDALKEIINIGGGNAATSMSEITGRSISVKIPRVEVLSYSEIFDRELASLCKTYSNGVQNRIFVITIG